MHATSSADNDRGTACQEALRRLLETLRRSPDAVNEELAFPQRMQVEEVDVDEVRTQGAKQCTAAVTLHVTAAALTYEIGLTLEGSRGLVTVRDEAGYKEQFDVEADAPPGEEARRRLYQSLSDAVVAQFGTDS